MTETLKAGLDKLVESLDAEARMRPFDALNKKYLSGSLARKYGAR